MESTKLPDRDRGELDEIDDPDGSDTTLNEIALGQEQHQEENSMAYEQQARQDHERWKRGRVHAHLSIDSEKFSPVATTSENTPSTSKARRIQPLSLDDDEDDEEDGVSFTSKDFLDDESQITDFKQLEKRSIRSSTRKIVTEETAPRVRFVPNIIISDQKFFGTRNS